MTLRRSQGRRLVARSLALILILAGFVGVPADAEVAQLRIGVQFGIGYLPVYIAREAGLIDQRLTAAGLPPVRVTLVPVAGAPQINDGLLSRSLEIGSGGITAMMVAWDKTRASKETAMKSIVALSALPYELLTTDPAVTSLKDLSERNKIGLPAVKVSVPAIFLQMAAERLYGPGNHGRLDPLTVSLAQPDGATSLLSGGGTIDSYVFAPPFNYQLGERPNIRKVWSSTELTGGAITSLVLWTTARFHEENPQTFRAVVAATRDAVALIKTDRRRAAEIYIKTENSKLSVDAGGGDAGAARDELRDRAAPFPGARRLSLAHRTDQGEPRPLARLFLPGDRRRERQLILLRRLIVRPSGMLLSSVLPRAFIAVQAGVPASGMQVAGAGAVGAVCGARG
jgi:NitT/TauT family transport system substrate-binding protein